MSTVLLIGGVVLLVVATFAGVFGRRQHRKRALVDGTETTDVRDIREEGLVELKGTVRVTDPFDSPIADERSVLAAWEVEEWNERGDSGMWETLTAGIHATAFDLDDGTGRVRVDVGDRVDDMSSGTGIDEVQVGPVDVDRLLSNGVDVGDVHAALDGFSVEATVPPDTAPPERIETFVRDEATIPAQTDSITNVVDVGNQHGERRYYEGTVGEGDDLYLLGQVRAVEDATYPLGPEDVVVAPTDDTQFILSDRSEAELVSSFDQYRYAYAAAAVTAVLGVAALLVGAGVV